MCPLRWAHRLDVAASAIREALLAPLLQRMKNCQTGYARTPRAGVPRRRGIDGSRSNIERDDRGWLRSAAARSTRARRATPQPARQGEAPTGAVSGDLRTASRGCGRSRPHRFVSRRFIPACHEVLRWHPGNYPPAVAQPARATSRFATNALAAIEERHGVTSSLRPRSDILAPRLPSARPVENAVSRAFSSGR